RARLSDAVDDRLHLRVQGGVRGGAEVSDRCRTHRRPRRVAHHRARAAAAVEAGYRDERDPELHLVVEQLPLAAADHARSPDADAAPRTRAVPVVHGGHHGRAVRVRGDGAHPFGFRLPDGAEGIRPRAHLGGDQGMNHTAWLRSRWVVVPGTIAIATLLWNAYVSTHDHGIVAGRVVD